MWIIEYQILRIKKRDIKKILRCSWHMKTQKRKEKIKSRVKGKSKTTNRLSKKVPRKSCVTIRV